MIPKIFHRVWLGGKPMPFYFQKWGESWLKKHPGWTMKLWTEREIQHFTNVDVLPKCSTLAMRSDVVRYEVLYREGGVYLDTDMECLKNIGILLQETEFFACWQRPDLNVLSNAIFGASKSHKILQSLTWGCRTEFRPEPWNAMGPTYFTPKVLGQPGVKIFKRETFIPYTRDQYKAFPKHPMLTLNPPEESFAINHRSSLWYKDSTAPLVKGVR
jgi:hypothetical protein